MSELVWVRKLEGDEIPHWWLAPAYAELVSGRVVLTVVGFHWLVRWFRSVWRKVRFGGLPDRDWRWHMEQMQERFDLGYVAGWNEATNKWVGEKSVPGDFR